MGVCNNCGENMDRHGTTCAPRTTRLHVGFKPPDELVQEICRLNTSLAVKDSELSLLREQLQRAERVVEKASSLIRSLRHQVMPGSVLADELPSYDAALSAFDSAKDERGSKP